MAGLSVVDEWLHKEPHLLIEYQYDDAGHLVTVGDAAGYTARYVYEGRLLTREVDEQGYTFHFSYDGDGPEARCVRTWGQDALYSRQLRYHPDQHVTTVTTADGSSKHHYNALGTGGSGSSKRTARSAIMTGASTGSCWRKAAAGGATSAVTITMIRAF